MPTYNLNPIHRILLTTDGSITGIIEAVTEKRVEVETIEQRVVKADGEMAKVLGVEVGDEINYRVVYLKAGDEIYAKAVSLTPIKRLEDRFKEDLMRADIPIGRIMKKHGIEARREILWGRVERADELRAEEFGIPASSLLLVRNYNIIHRGEVLMNITETFPAEKFRI